MYATYVKFCYTVNVLIQFHFILSFYFTSTRSFWLQRGLKYKNVYLPLWFDLDWLFICKIVSNREKCLFFLPFFVCSFIHNSQFIHRMHCVCTTRWYQRGIFVCVCVLFLFLYGLVVFRLVYKKYKKMRVANCWCNVWEMKWQERDNIAIIGFLLENLQQRCMCMKFNLKRPRVDKIWSSNNKIIEFSSDKDDFHSLIIILIAFSSR